MRKLLTSGDGLYFKNINDKLLSFITSRFVPFAGFTLITILISRFNYPELGEFSYLTAMFSLPVVLMSMPLAMIGNISVEYRKKGFSGRYTFLSGLPLAVTLSVIGAVTSCFMSFAFNISPDKNTMLACKVYVACTPLLILNTYLFYYIESVINNKSMAKIKIISTFISATLILATSLSVKKLLTWHVFSIFCFVEFFLSVMYLFVIFRYLKSEPIIRNKISYKLTTGKLMSVGLPVAFGLAGQKSVYFLITQTLTKINIDLVSDLSVMMSVIGILSLPFAAFSQIHSLFVSENNLSSQYRTFKKGVAFSIIAILITIVLSWVLYPFIIELYSANTELLKINYFFSASILFASSSLMLLCMSHLRALHDTLFPQMLAVAVLLLGFIPTVWLQNLSGGDVYKILYIQSIFTFFIFITLSIRIKFFIKNRSEAEVTS